MLAAPFDATRSRAGFADATNNASTFANDSKTFATSSAPGARCGHTMTALRWNQKTKIVTFGGATELEGGSGANASANVGLSPQAGRDAGAWVKLSGATNELHVLDPFNGEWGKLELSLIHI